MLRIVMVVTCICMINGGRVFRQFDGQRISVELEMNQMVMVEFKPDYQMDITDRFTG